MKVKDNNGNVVEIYQARGGAIFLIWGRYTLCLDRKLLDFFRFEDRLRDLEDFSEENYKKFYDLI